MEWGEFVDQRRNSFYIQDKLSITDIKCPVCKQYIFVDNSMILASNPPQRRYICKKCGWKGTA